MAIHSSILAWRIIWTEEPDGLQSMGSVAEFISWAPKSLQMVTAAMKLKDAFALEEKL